MAILITTFAFVQLAPGGPIENIAAKLQGLNTDATSRISGSAAGASEGKSDLNRNTAVRKETPKYRGTQGLDPDLIRSLEKQFGFDQPMGTRFLKMIKNYLTFDFGKSFYRDEKVIDIIASKLPVSMSLGIFSTLIIYLVAIPLGIKKAVTDGSRFDTVSSYFIIIGYAIPAFLFAIFLIIIFCGGKYFGLFPLRGLVSDNWHELSFIGKITDYLWHLCLPVTAMVIGGFASLTMLTKNSFLEELGKQYVLTARAKGCSEKRVLYKHVFRNAMLIVIAGFPSALVNMLFTGSVLIEVIFSLDGLGLLGFEAVVNRDYPIMFATLYIFGLLGLVLNIISDLTYHLVDPRIDFKAR